MHRATLAVAAWFILGLWSTACTGSDPADGDDGVGTTGLDPACAEEFRDKPNASAPDLQARFGAPCTTDAECVPILGEGARCYQDVLKVYALPGGYCSRGCQLPDAETMYVADDPTCDPAGGVDCIGLDGFFSACAVRCTEDSECGREGYGCVRMPIISSPGDPQYCLMNAAKCCLDASEC